MEQAESGGIRPLIAKTYEYLTGTWPGRGLLLLGIVGAAAGIWLAWWLISPLFLSGERADEMLISAPDPMTGQMPGGMDTPAPGGMETPAPGSMDTSTPSTDTSMPATGEQPPSSGGPVLIRTGEFNQIDRSHSGHGLANIYRLEDGSHVLQLEDAPGDTRTFSNSNGPAGEEVDGWEVSNGPQLAVYLSATLNNDSTRIPREERDTREEWVSLRSLGGVTSGTLSIPLPDDIDIDDYNSVVIWCVPFSVNFSSAALSTP